jgi:hypothetical protein
VIALKDGYQTFGDLIYRVEVVVIHIGLEGEFARLQLADWCNYQPESDFELCRGLYFSSEAALHLDRLDVIVDFASIQIIGLSFVFNAAGLQDLGGSGWLNCAREGD